MCLRRLLAAPAPSEPTIRKNGKLCAMKLRLAKKRKPHSHQDCKLRRVNLLHNGDMKRLLQFLQRLTGKPQKVSLHTPEELACFKRDAIENRRKHY